MAELMALPADAFERTKLVPLFIEFRFQLPGDPSHRTPDEEELIVTGEEYVEALRNEGQRRGRTEGMEAVLAHLTERRLKRPLGAAERAALQAHLVALGAEQVSDLVMDLSPDALAAWLAQKAA